MAQKAGGRTKEQNHRASKANAARGINQWEEEFMSPRFGGGQGQEYSTGYTLEYWREEGGWRRYTNTSGSR